jgi:hypothetical protein
MPDYNGWETRSLSNAHLELEVLSDCLRLVRLKRRGGTELFADLGRKELQTEHGLFYFHGGHRLWHSPEAMPRTYVPDHGGLRITELEHGVRLDQPAEPVVRVAKSLELRLDPQRPVVHLRHELRNEGPWPVELAPWALTMLRLGGVAVFPQQTGSLDQAGLLPNRNLVFWSYTRLQDARLQLGDDFILLRGAADLPPVKFGYFNPHGWEAYWLEDTLFVKRFDPLPGAAFPDGGCNCESYCNDQFLELESLAPLARLEPGAAVGHAETWELYDSLDQPFLPPALRESIRRNLP